jgi:hypothetical protein
MVTIGQIPGFRLPSLLLEEDTVSFSVNLFFQAGALSIRY